MYLTYILGFIYLIEISDFVQLTKSRHVQKRHARADQRCNVFEQILRKLGLCATPKGRPGQNVDMIYMIIALVTLAGATRALLRRLSD